MDRSHFFRIQLNKDDAIPSILEPVGDPEFRKNWARLIQKIYETDPLTCPKCDSQMRVISVIKQDEIIKKILKHLGLWDQKARPPPKIRSGAESDETVIDVSFSQLPMSDNHLYVDPVYPETFTT